MLLVEMGREERKGTSDPESRVNWKTPGERGQGRTPTALWSITQYKVVSVVVLSHPHHVANLGTFPTHIYTNALCELLFGIN